MLLSVLPSSAAFFSIFFFSEEGIRIDVAIVLSDMVVSSISVLIVILFVFTCKLKKGKLPLPQYPVNLSNLNLHCYGAKT